MRLRTLIIVIACVMVATGAIFVVGKMMAPIIKEAGKDQQPPAPVVQTPQPATPPKPVEVPKQRVVIFVVPKLKGEVINAATDLTIELRPAPEVPSDALTSSEPMSDPNARNRLDGDRLLRDVKIGDFATMSIAEDAPKAPQVPDEVKAAVEADRAFLQTLETDPQIILFTESQLSDLALRADVIADVWMESPVTAVGPDWVGRQLIVSGVTLRAASLNVTGQGAAKPVFYAKVSKEEANKIRAAQASASGSVKLEPHRDMRDMPSIGHICVGPNLCFEAIEPGSRSVREQATDGAQPIQDKAAAAAGAPAAKQEKAVKSFVVKPAAAPAN